MQDEGSLERNLGEIESCRAYYDLDLSFQDIIWGAIQYLQDPQAVFRLVDMGSAKNQLPENFAYLIECLRERFDIRGRVEALGFDENPLVDATTVAMAHAEVEYLLLFLDETDERFRGCKDLERPERGPLAVARRHDLEQGLPDDIRDINLLTSFQVWMYLERKIELTNQGFARLHPSHADVFMNDLAPHFIRLRQQGRSVSWSDYLRKRRMHPLFNPDSRVRIKGETLYAQNRSGCSPLEVPFPGLRFDHSTANTDNRTIPGGFMRISHYELED